MKTNKEWQKELERKLYDEWTTVDSENTVTIEGSRIKEFIEQLLNKEKLKLLEGLHAIEKEKWGDAEHCSCLGFAIHKICCGDEKEESCPTNEDCINYWKQHHEN